MENKDVIIRIYSAASQAEKAHKEYKKAVSQAVKDNPERGGDYENAILRAKENYMTSIISAFRMYKKAADPTHL
jgi:hypothetical protein